MVESPAKRERPKALACDGLVCRFSLLARVGAQQRHAESAKWLLSAAMLLGRLELFTVLVLFSTAFWRN
jgi:hypothetical protein